MIVEANSTTAIPIILYYRAFQSEALYMTAVCTSLHKAINYPTHTTQHFTMTTMSLATAKSA